MFLVMTLARPAIARMAEAERATDRVIGRLLGNATRILPRTLRAVATAALPLAFNVAVIERVTGRSLRAVATAVWPLAFNVAVIECVTGRSLLALRFMVAARRGIYIMGCD